MKIHIIGGPGGGKTWLAKHLSHKYNVPTFDLDDIFWDRNAGRYGVKAAPEKRDSDLNAILNKNSWIVEGVYYSWLMRSFQLSDRIIVLKTSTRLRAVRIIKRFIKRKTGLIKSKKESLSDLWQLLKWNHGFDRNNLKPALRIIADFQDKVIYYENLSQISKEIENGLVSPCRLYDPSRNSKII
jgi:adenylate kinase family enzyme